VLHWVGLRAESEVNDVAVAVLALASSFSRFAADVCSRCAHAIGAEKRPRASMWFGCLVLTRFVTPLPGAFAGFARKGKPYASATVRARSKKLSGKVFLDALPTRLER